MLSYVGKGNLCMHAVPNWSENNYELTNLIYRNIGILWRFLSSDSIHISTFHLSSRKRYKHIFPIFVRVIQGNKGLLLHVCNMWDCMSLWVEQVLICVGVGIRWSVYFSKSDHVAILLFSWISNGWRVYLTVNEFTSVIYIFQGRETHSAFEQTYD